MVASAVFADIFRATPLCHDAERCHTGARRARMRAMLMRAQRETPIEFAAALAAMLPCRATAKMCYVVLVCAGTPPPCRRASAKHAPSSDAMIDDDFD